MDRLHDPGSGNANGMELVAVRLGTKSLEIRRQRLWAQKRVINPSGQLDIG
jgi:hypothetical protein